MFDKCYLNCFLYSVCKNQETIAYKVFTKTRACDGVVCFVSNPPAVILCRGQILFESFYSLNSAYWIPDVCVWEDKYKA